mmetsp:Transcript_5588/g.17634  ORF Transcript_5588/g.17634 Transcript_5588/m.17634 type:complete len:375 (-) Transcript_5588:48-1172(-)
MMMRRRRRRRGTVPPSGQAVGLGAAAAQVGFAEVGVGRLAAAGAVDGGADAAVGGVAGGVLAELQIVEGEADLSKRGQPRGGDREKVRSDAADGDAVLGEDSFEQVLGISLAHVEARVVREVLDRRHREVGARRSRPHDGHLVRVAAVREALLDDDFCFFREIGTPRTQQKTVVAELDQRVKGRKLLEVDPAAQESDPLADVRFGARPRVDAPLFFVAARKVVLPHERPLLLRRLVHNDSHSRQNKPPNALRGPGRAAARVRRVVREVARRVRQHQHERDLVLLRASQVPHLRLQLQPRHLPRHAHPQSLLFRSAFVVTRLLLCRRSLRRRRRRSITAAKTLFEEAHDSAPLRHELRRLRRRAQQPQPDELCRS